MERFWSAFTQMAEQAEAPQNDAAVFEKGLRQINLSGRVAKGLNGAIRAIIKNKAQVVFLANNCDNKDYKGVITGLCQKYKVKLYNVPDKAVMGQALGLTNLKSNGDVRKQINCGVCAITKFGNVNTPDTDAFRALYPPADSA